MMNLMIPFLSPEDQRTVASTLARVDPKNFGHLDPLQVEFEEVRDITPDIRGYYTGSERPTQALVALNRLSGAVGKSREKMGEGYRFLQQVLDVSRDYGEGGLTKQEMAPLFAALDPLLQQNELYGGLGQMLSQPSFSAGPLFNVRKTQDGRYVFGRPNPQLFF
jgi:hypothetical protein